MSDDPPSSRQRKKNWNYYSDDEGGEEAAPVSRCLAGPFCDNRFFVGGAGPEPLPRKRRHSAAVCRFCRVPPGSVCMCAFMGLALCACPPPIHHLLPPATTPFPLPPLRAECQNDTDRPLLLFFFFFSVSLRRVYVCVHVRLCYACLSRVGKSIKMKKKIVYTQTHIKYIYIDITHIYYIYILTTFYT